MKIELSPNRHILPTGLKFLLVILLVLGIFFRFVYLDRKIYWGDETYTSLRVSGYTEAEVAQQLAQGDIVSVEDLQKYQRTNAEKNVINTVKGLAAEEPQLPPLYFLMTRFWVQLFGNSIAVTRSLSAVFSLLALPCLYWLCLELFNSPLVGWLAIAIFTISPFQVIYAQEARPYTLWTVFILISSASLLRARRLNTLSSWILYAVTLALGMYTHLFFALVIIAHFVYVLATEQLQWNKLVKAYLIASLAGVLACAPWLIIFISKLPQVFTMTAVQVRQSREPLLFYIKNWLGNLGRLFIDFGLNSRAQSLYLISFALVALGIFILVIYSLYFLCKNTPRQFWFFLLTLIIVPSLALMLPDLIFGGQRSVFSRYLIPSYLGIQITIAYLFSSQMSFPFVRNNKQKFWLTFLTILISCSILSCAIRLPTEVWWNTDRYNSHNPQVARIINSSNSPLLIGEVPNSSPRYSLFNIVSLSYFLNSKVRFKFVPEQTVPEIPKDFSDVFFLNPSDVLKTRTEKKYKSRIEPIYDGRETLLLKLAKN